MTEPADPVSPTPAAQPWPRWPAVILGTLVTIFAFLAASFTARNSDVWLHLASGRLLAQGRYDFGADPFAYTTEGVYWANHAWLFDLGLYAGFRALGGSGLVALKAAAVALLAALLLRLSRPRTNSGRAFWVAGACTLLAVLAMSPRLQLQPVSVSLVLLAVCLWLLRRGGRALYALPAVVALWVNLDAWFILGPLLVALFSLGQLLGRARLDEARIPFWLLPACLAACLLSPHHVHALTLPVELSPAVWRSELAGDYRFAPMFVSPWHREMLGRAGGYNLSAWAFFVLLALGTISFAANRSALRGWRLPVWLVFAGLAAWQMRLMPFFAVVAGPITALNFRALAVANGRGAFRRIAFVPWLAVGLAAVALVALTWPGWLQGFHRRDRGLAWGVHADPSLRRVAETVSRWRQRGELPPDARTFATHPDAAHHLAWFCPGEKSYLDSRLSRFLPVAAEYERVCSAVESPRTGDTEPVLRDRKIACLILYDPDLRRLAPSLRQVAQSPGRWDLLHVDGQAAVVGWKDAATPHPPLFDADRAAFALGDDDTLPPAPASGPAALARSAPEWVRHLDRPTGLSWEAGAAAVYLRLFEDAAARHQARQHGRAIPRHLAGVVGLPAAPAGAVATFTDVAARLVSQGAFLPDLQEQPPALPLLAVRATRRAVAAHPDDAVAWFRLAQAYHALGGTTEGSAFNPLPPLVQIRRIQTVTALVQAVTVNPDLAEAHDALAELFVQTGYLDLALKHRDAQVRLLRGAARPRGEERAAFDARMAVLEKMVEQLRAVVQDNENRYAVRAQGLTAKPFARAQLALQLGLAAKALDDVLLRSHADLYGPEGIRLLLELLLLTGRSEDARDLLDRDELRSNPDGLGELEPPGGATWRYRFPAYDWCDLCRAAGAGDYDRAASAVTRLRDRMQREGDRLRARLAPELAVRLGWELGLAAVPETVLFGEYNRMERNRLVGWLVQGQFLLVERADLHAVAGMLDLERGRPTQAAEQFRAALPLYDAAAATAPALPGRYLARRYLDLIGAPAGKAINDRLTNLLGANTDQ